MSNTANRLREAMRITGMKQVDLIERTGISKGALSSYLSGRYEPKQNNLYALAKELGVSPAWLMGLDVPMTSVGGSMPIQAAPSPAAAPPSPEQADLLEKYDSLSDTGRELLLSRADELIRLGYTIEEEAKKDVRKSS